MTESLPSESNEEGLVVRHAGLMLACLPGNQAGEGVVVVEERESSQSRGHSKLVKQSGAESLRLGTHGQTCGLMAL